MFDKDGMRKYAYTPLPSSQSTRLFEFLPGEVTASIKCRISAHDLDLPHTPEYTALSYCWGSPNKSCSITLNDGFFDVTANLHSALEVLRASYGTSPFWVDAICIDQSNLCERGQQVQNMRRIYEQASRIVIWLGPGDRLTRVTMHWIKRLSELCDSLVSNDPTDKRKLYDSCVERIHDIFESPRGVADLTTLHGLAQLLSKPWFERVWIIQESTIPNKDILVHCGDSVVEWTSLTTVTEIVTHLMWRPELRSFFTDAPTIDNQSLRRLFNLEKQRQRGKPTLRFIQILAKYRHFKATDPRDKIYALRGLAADLSEDEVIPDYSLSFQDAYTQLAKHFLIAKRSFECLGFCDYAARNLDHPSWVPDWSKKTSRHPLAKRSVHDSPEEIPSVYKAGIEPAISHGPTEWHCNITNGHVLNVAGFRVDFVHRVAKFEVPELLPATKSPLSHESQILGHKTAIYGVNIPDSKMYRNTAEPLKMAYSRTIVADLAKSGNIRSRGYSVTLDYWRDIRDISRPQAGAQYRKEWGSLLFATTGRSLFWSKEGYLGLGSMSTEPGDHICIFLGADVVHLLRPVEGGYHLVGECYVHGLMDGEVFSLFESGLRKVQSFSIL